MEASMPMFTIEAEWPVRDCATALWWGTDGCQLTKIKCLGKGNTGKYYGKYQQIKRAWLRSRVKRHSAILCITPLRAAESHPHGNTLACTLTYPHPHWPPFKWPIQIGSSIKAEDQYICPESTTTILGWPCAACSTIMLTMEGTSN